MGFMEKLLKPIDHHFGQMYIWKKTITFNDFQPTSLRFKTGKPDRLIFIFCVQNTYIFS